MRVWLPRLLFFLLLLFLPGCRAQAVSGPGQTTTEPIERELVVFAAASLTEAFAQIGQAFEVQHPGVTVTFNLGSSAQLAQQLAQGAPADVFASADVRTMEVVAEARRVSGDMQQIFARNRLVVITPPDNPAGIASLPDLARPGLRLVLAAKEVPAGKYALDFLEKASRDPAFGPSYQVKVLKNVVSYEENVKAVFSKVALGEAEAGIVYTSDLSKTNREKVHSLEIPGALNVNAEYAIAPLRDSQDRELAQAFVDFVLTPEGQTVLEEYGFIPLNQ